MLRFTLVCTVLLLASARQGEVPTQLPTAAPTKTPTDAPTRTPTDAPTPRPTGTPTTGTPTAPPTPQPTRVPTNAPTPRPTATPTTGRPTAPPTPVPTRVPTNAPTPRPTGAPTPPTSAPTRAPTAPPTPVPTRAPTTRRPTAVPTTSAPTGPPTSQPTRLPTRSPTQSPTRVPTTQSPTNPPTKPPTTPVLCDWCPYECVKGRNPPFTSACDLNLVMIVDESYSIFARDGDNFDYTSAVRAAIKAFWSSLGTLLNIGGSAKLGGVVFGSVSMSFTNDKIRSLTPAYIAELDAWADNAPGTNGYNPVDYQPTPPRRGGFTNWGSAFRLTRTTAWTDDNNQPVTPSIAIMFTDGQPTRADPFDDPSCAVNCPPNINACPLACPANAVFANYSFVGAAVGANSNFVATACYQAELLKAAGTRLFIVGVGGLGTDGYRMIQDMTGPIAWNLDVATFATSDYVLNPQLDQLANVLYSVAIGLCPCLQQQSLCRDDTTNPNRACISTFSARVRISSVAASAVYPANGVTVAYMYYDFSGATTQRVAYQFFDPTNVPSAGLPLLAPLAFTPAQPYPQFVREDIHNPCEISRRVECVSGCYQLTDRQFVPRFFHEQGDTLNPAQSPPNPTNGVCSVVYEKPATLLPEQIRFIWGEQVGAQFILCAAVANDGTLFEFLDGIVPGGIGYGLTPNTVEQRPVRNAVGVSTAGGAPFAFERPGACSAVLCRSPVETIFVIDEQAVIDVAEFTSYRSYVQNIVDQFDTQGLIRFGLVWTNDRTPVGATTPAVVNTVQFDNNHVSFKNKVAVHVKRGGATDFAAAIDFAIERAWPLPKTASSPARHVVVIVGGPDSPTGSAPSWPTLRNKRDARGVEIWGVAVNRGASNIQFLDNFVSTNGYKHSGSFPSSSLLSFDAQGMGSRLCPGVATLCDGCNGFCACPGQCSCPTCVNSACGARTCLSPATGCVGDDTACDDNNLCTTDRCFVNIATGLASCLYTPRTCNDFDDCTVDACVATTGCTFTPKTCNDADVCTDDICDLNLAGNCTYIRRPNCVVTPSCQANPCAPSGDACTSNLCIGEASGTFPGALYCNSPAVVAAGLRAQCEADLLRVGALQQYFCFQEPRRNCSSTTCFTQVCDAVTGQCVAGAPITCNDGDSCTIDTCDQDVGCRYTPRVCPRLDQCKNRLCYNTPPVPNPNNVDWECALDNTANVDVVCVDSDPCTIDTCDPTVGCVYTPKVCNTTLPCSISNCNNVTGACVPLVLPTLLDFCGICGGDNTGCFFANTNDLKAAGGIAGGIVAAIVIAAVIALLLAIWAAKRGYDHYAAASALNAGGAMANPTFKGRDGAGEVPDGVM